MSHEENTTNKHLQEQLDLYKEVVDYYRLREKLIQSVGTADGDMLHSMVTSMEAQLKDFYATKDADHPDHQTSGIDTAALAAELGTTDAHDIIAMVKNMEAQLKDFYAKGDQDHPDFVSSNGSSSNSIFQEELGTSNPEEVVAMVKNMEAQLKDFYALKDEDVLSEDILF